MDKSNAFTYAYNVGLFLKKKHKSFPFKCSSLDLKHADNLKLR